MKFILTPPKEFDVDFNVVLALALYKTIKPSDYNKIYNGNSNIDYLFNNKTILINKLVENKKEKLMELESKLNKAKNYIEKNKTELMSLLEVEIAKKYNREIVKIDEQYNFESTKIKYKFKDKGYYNRNWYTEDANINEDIYLEFKERYNYIMKPDILVDDIKKIKTEINNVSQFKMHKIFSKLDDQTIIKLMFPKQEEQHVDLLISLIKLDLIREDYKEYVYGNEKSVINTSDSNFINRVFAKRSLKFDYVIHNYEYVLEALESELENHFILNYGLLEYVLNKKQKENSFITYHNYFNRLKKNINANNKRVSQFIKSYDGKQITIENFSLYIYDKENVILDIKKIKNNEIKLALFASYINLNSLEVIQKNKFHIKELIKMMEGDLTKYFNIYETEEIVKKLSIFKHEKLIGESSLIKGIFNNEAFEINKENLATYLTNFSKASYKYNHPLTFALEGERLKKYFNDNIEKIVESTLEMFKDLEEDEEVVVKILMTENIKKELKFEFISKVNTKLSNISEIKDKELIEKIIKKNLIHPTEINITCLVQYLNETSFENIKDIIIDRIIELDKESYLNLMKIIDITPHFLYDYEKSKELIVELIKKTSKSKKVDFKLIIKYLDELKNSDLIEEQIKSGVINQKNVKDLVLKLSENSTEATDLKLENSNFKIKINKQNEKVFKTFKKFNLLNLRKVRNETRYNVKFKDE